jgi:hypothetical protein
MTGPAASTRARLRSARPQLRAALTEVEEQGSAAWDRWIGAPSAEAQTYRRAVDAR